jgi:hypothetical protein
MKYRNNHHFGQRTSGQVTNTSLCTGDEGVGAESVQGGHTEKLVLVVPEMKTGSGRKSSEI